MFPAAALPVESSTRHTANTHTLFPAALPTDRNTSLVVLVGNARGGELAWQSLYRELLDPWSADLALAFASAVLMLASLMESEMLTMCKLRGPRPGRLRLSMRAGGAHAAFTVCVSTSLQYVIGLSRVFIAGTIYLCASSTRLVSHSRYEVRGTMVRPALSVRPRPATLQARQRPARAARHAKERIRAPRAERTDLERPRSLSRIEQV